jgi:hypothetical protein
VGAYYYLAAQLPYLVYGQKPPMSSLAFKELARTLLDGGDARLLDLVDLDPQPPGVMEGPSYSESSAASGSDFIDHWREWERTLRLNLARHRSIKLKREKDAPVDPPAFPNDAAAVAKSAVGAETPLEGEIMIDKARWNAIEAFQGGDCFDRNIIFAYLLKLVLLERQTSFNAQEGLSEYKSLYASISDRVQVPVGEPK